MSAVPDRDGRVLVAAPAFERLVHDIAAHTGCSCATAAPVGMRDEQVREALDG